MKQPKLKLKYLGLRRCQLVDDTLEKVCHALVGNSTITSLSLGSNEQITSVGWQALSTVILHSTSKLTNLSLNSAGLTDDTINILGSASGSLKTLNLSQSHSVSSEGWQMFLNQLAQTDIESLDLSGNALANFGLALVACISTLKYLKLCRTRSCTPIGWQYYFNSLQRRGTRLEKLDITYNCIGNEGIAALGNLLSNTCTLKTLNVFNVSRLDNNSVTIRGWVSFFNSLQDSNVDLDHLCLSYNDIDDDCLQFLGLLVSSMNSLKCLELGNCESISPAGWQSLTGYLESPNCTLEELALDGNNLNDDTVAAFASALVHNNTLKRLSLSGCYEIDAENEEENDEAGNYSITERGWEAISTLICNKTSIMDTYNSNHTLQDLSDAWYYDEEVMPDDLIRLLDLNKNKDKTEVVRQKILQTHFSNEVDAISNIQEFLDMEFEVMPAAISWMGRLTFDEWSGSKVSGLSLLYNLIRRVPDLFDSSPQKKSMKRKRN